jgi:hypothetical protein
MKYTPLQGQHLHSNTAVRVPSHKLFNLLIWMREALALPFKKRIPSFYHKQITEYSLFLSSGTQQSKCWKTTQ